MKHYFHLHMLTLCFIFSSIAAASAQDNKVADIFINEAEGFIAAFYSHDADHLDWHDPNSVAAYYDDDYRRIMNEAYPAFTDYQLTEDDEFYIDKHNYTLSLTNTRKNKTIFTLFFNENGLIADSRNYLLPYIDSKTDRQRPKELASDRQRMLFWQEKFDLITLKENTAQSSAGNISFTVFNGNQDINFHYVEVYIDYYNNGGEHLASQVIAGKGTLKAKTGMEISAPITPEVFSRGAPAGYQVRLFFRK
jgi:hypothetical protein